MELELVRTYFPKGANGDIYYNGKRLCSTIELPWLENKPRYSCIPEGRYELKKRFSRKYKIHLQVKDVRGRSFILVHPANDALKELKGCIAPVSFLTGEGRGSRSVAAMEKLKAVVLKELEKNNKVYLTIKSNDYEIE